MPTARHWRRSSPSTCLPDKSSMSGSAVNCTPPLVAQQPRATSTVWWVGLLAAATWFAAAVVTAGWPDIYDLDYTPLLTWIQGILGVILLVASFVAQGSGRLGHKLRYAGAWLVAIGLVF